MLYTQKLEIMNTLKQVRVFVILFFTAGCLKATTPYYSANEVPESYSGFRYPLTYNFSGNGGYQWLDTANYGYIVRHPGSDLNVPDAPGGGCDGDKGLDVISASTGRVVYRNSNGWGGVVIQHNYKGETWFSQYGHVQNIIVYVGQVVNRGQKIAEIGDVGTGCAHLHFEIRSINHPDPAYGDYFGSQLNDPFNVQNWYRDPFSFVNSHLSYFNLVSPISVMPNPMQQNNPVSITVDLKNNDGSSWYGTVYCSLYDVNDNFIAHIDQKDVSFWTYDTKTISFYKPVIYSNPWIYKIHISCQRYGNSYYSDVHPSSFENPININIGSGNVDNNTQGSSGDNEVVLEDDFYEGYKSFWSFDDGIWEEKWHELHQTDREEYSATAETPTIDVKSHKAFSVAVTTKITYSHNDRGTLYIYFPGGYLSLNDKYNELKIRTNSSYYYNYDVNTSQLYHILIQGNQNMVKVTLNNQVYQVPTTKWRDDAVVLRIRRGTALFDDFVVKVNDQSSKMMSTDSLAVIPDSLLHSNDIQDSAEELEIKEYQDLHLRDFISFFHKPNPFRECTTIHYTSDIDGNARIALYNITGEKIGEIKHWIYGGKSYDFILYANNAFGQKLSPGIYLYTFVVNNQLYGADKLVVTE